jgi:hypothetical protein
MQNYEIRVLNDDLSSRAVVEQRYISDQSAIRSARQFAESRRFEVWRGLTCVSGVIRAMPVVQPSPGAPVKGEQ